jgi:hypothetical protein
MLCRSCWFAVLSILLIGAVPRGAQAVTAVVESRVSASSEDAEQKVGSTSVSLTSSDLELVTDGLPQTVGMRFAGLALPPGVPIVDAWLQFTVDEAQSEVTALTIRAQAADDAPTFSTAANNVAGRATTAASVGWAPLPWSTVGAAGADQRVNGLAPVIQEVVNRPGWQSGHALALLVTGSGHRTAVAFDGTSTGAPLLHVVWDATGYDFPPNVTITTPGDHAMFTAGSAVTFSATATDPEQGNVSASLSWFSNRNGSIGSGASFTVSNLVTGVHTITATASDAAGHTGSATFQIEIASGRFVLVGAGDIASCSRTTDTATDAVVAQQFGTVIVLGDNAYPDGSAADYQNCYGPTWGRERARTRPATGNHEYGTANAAGYFGYFGAAAGNPGQGWYAYDADSWRVIVLNSNCSDVGGCTRSSAQGLWLQAELAAHPRACTVAMWHHPRFSSGALGDKGATVDLWQLLYEAGADLVLSGHDHQYERFAAQSPAGLAEPTRGIRQFIVGTGGDGVGGLGVPKPNSEISNASSYGAIKLTLRPGAYDWQFLPAVGSSFTDAGTASCVAAGPVNGLPQVHITSPANGSGFPANSAVSFAATAVDPEQGNLAANLTWSSDRDGPIGTGPSFTSSALSAGTHSITARVTDAAGGVGQDQVNISLVTAGSITTQGRVGASVDDAEERVSDGRMSLTSSDLELINDSTDQLVGVRFAGVAVPHGARILDAYVQFKVDEVSIGATTLALQAEASDDAAAFTSTARSVSLRPRGSAAVSWTPNPWPTVGAIGLDQRTPSLVSLIQPVVDRAGWSSGNSLVLIITGSGARVAKSFDGDAAGAPLLVIEYTLP